MRTEYEDKIAKIDQKSQKTLEERDEAKVANMKARHNENLSKLQTRIADLEKTNSNYDSVLSSLTRFLSVEASKRNIKLKEPKTLHSQNRLNPLIRIKVPTITVGSVKRVSPVQVVCKDTSILFIKG